MTSNSPTHMVVVKKEEKEAKLRMHLAGALAQIAVANEIPVLRVLAKSSASPVVLAIASLQAELAAAGVEARVMFASLETAGTQAIGQTCSVRHLADTRFHDAHEMLVLGPVHTWVGDCMRRDPASRDSFELHANGSSERARWVANSFDKLWARALPIDGPAVQALAETMELAADLAGLPVDPPVPPQVLTRH